MFCFSFQLRLRERTLLTRWPADWAKKGVHPPTLPPPLSADSFRGPSPTLPHRSFQGSGMTSLMWTLHLATLSVAGRLTAKWVRGTRERGVRPGEIPGQASHPTTQFHAIPSSVQAPTQELCAKSTRAEGLLGSKRQGKVCRGFKVIPRSSCLRHRDATHGSPTVPPIHSWPTWRILPKSQVPLDPKLSGSRLQSHRETPEQSSSRSL